MKQRTRYAPRRAGIPAAALAALLLAGCSSGHIGETWQCPLAKGGSCDSVAAADPAVPDMGNGTVPGEPLWLVRETRRVEAPAEPSCEAECAGGFDPFAWLARLFGGGEEDKPGANAKSPPAAVAAPPPETGPEHTEPDTGPFPAEAAPDGDDPHGDDLRTGEVVARIWIAPFVDGDGVYREASHVRAVLEPAGWRLP